MGLHGSKQKHEKGVIFLFWGKSLFGHKKKLTFPFGNQKNSKFFIHHGSKFLFRIGHCRHHDETVGFFHLTGLSLRSGPYP
jgi:hypothetical protein